MRRPTIALTLTLAATSGCAGDEPKAPPEQPPGKAVATCAGAECKVRVTCNGKVHVRVGPAPVDVRTTRSALRTSVTADFAGSRHDAVVRC